MNDDLYDLLSELDDFSDSVARSKYRFFSQNLQRWFDFMDQSPSLAPIVRTLEATIDFDSWRKESMSSRESMAHGTLQWPRDGSARLGAFIGLFRRFSANEDEAFNFVLDYISLEANFNDMIFDLVDQVFDPMVRDLRRHFERVLSASD